MRHTTGWSTGMSECPTAALQWRPHLVGFWGVLGNLNQALPRGHHEDNVAGFLALVCPLSGEHLPHEDTERPDICG